MAVRRRRRHGQAPLTHMGKYQGRVAGDALPGHEAGGRRR